MDTIHTALKHSLDHTSTLRSPTRPRAPIPPARTRAPARALARRRRRHFGGDAARPRHESASRAHHTHCAHHAAAGDGAEAKGAEAKGAENRGAKAVVSSTHADKSAPPKASGVPSVEVDLSKGGRPRPALGKLDSNSFEHVPAAAEEAPKKEAKKRHTLYNEKQAAGVVGMP